MVLIVLVFEFQIDFSGSSNKQVIKQNNNFINRIRFFFLELDMQDEWRRKNKEESIKKRENRKKRKTGFSKPMHIRRNVGNHSSLLHSGRRMQHFRLARSHSNKKISLKNFSGWLYYSPAQVPFPGQGGVRGKRESDCIVKQLFKVSFQIPSPLFLL